MEIKNGKLCKYASGGKKFKICGGMYIAEGYVRIYVDYVEYYVEAVIENTLIAE